MARSKKTTKSKPLAQQVLEEKLKYYSNLNKNSKKKEKEEKVLDEQLKYYSRLNEEAGKEEEKKNVEVKRVLTGSIVFLIIFILVAIGFKYLILGQKPWTIGLWILVLITSLVIFSSVIFMRNKDKKEHREMIILCIELLGLIVLINQANLMSNQNNILDVQTSISTKQTEIIDRTSQSILPEILLASAEGLRTYHVSELTNGSKDKINLGITNLGQTTAPYVSIGIESVQFIGLPIVNGSSINGPFIVTNLPSKEYNSTWFEFVIHRGSNKTSAPIGVVNLSFKVQCGMCLTPEQVQNIEICVYNVSPQSQCGSKWINKK